MAPLPNLVPASGVDLTPGALVPLALTQPNPGTGFTYTIPGGVLAQVLTLGMVLVTDAVVANRLFAVTLFDPDTNVIYSKTAGATVPASTNAFFTVGTQVPSDSSPLGSRLCVALPAVYLPGGYKIQVQVLSMDASDQITAPHGLLLELDPSRYYPAGGVDEWMPSARGPYRRTPHA